MKTRSAAPPSTRRGTRSGLVNVTNVAGNKRSALSKSKKPSNGSTTTPKKPLATVRVAAKRLSSGKARPGRKENPAEATAVHDQDDMADDVSSAAGSDYDSDTGNEPAKNPVVKRARQSSSPTDNKTPKKQRLAIPSQFNSASKILSTPGTGKKSGTQGSQTPKTPASVYQEAKAAFRRCATPSRLIGRGKERKAICAFIEHHVLQCSSGALYISGCPGTGKTALLNEVIRTMAPEFGSMKHNVVQMFVNCMSVSDPKHIYSRIVAKATGEEDVTQNEAADEFERLIFPTKKAKKETIFFIILDEIDQLISKDQKILYSLFEWAADKKSKLVLIGIANALDLTDRFLPRLKAKGCEPMLLNFNPYHVDEITAIIKDRLISLDEDADTLQSPSKKPSGSVPPPSVKVPLMQPAAIEIAARKIANTGDLRKALDVCRRAIELVESEAKPSLTSPTQGSQSTSQDFNSPVKDMHDLPKVTIRHILSATSAFTGSPNISKIKALNVNQKMILCSMMFMRASHGEKMTIPKVFEAYTKICKFNNYNPVTAPEFKELINMIEASGVITLKALNSSKDSITSQMVSLNVQAPEIDKACRENHTLARVLDNGTRPLIKKTKL